MHSRSVLRVAGSPHRHIARDSLGLGTGVPETFTFDTVAPSTGVPEAFTFDAVAPSTMAQVRMSLYSPTKRREPCPGSEQPSSGRNSAVTTKPRSANRRLEGLEETMGNLLLGIADAWVIRADYTLSLHKIDVHVDG